MKILFLSSVTLHHNFFINSILEHFSDWKFAVINEQGVNFKNWATAKKKLKEIFKKKSLKDLLLFFPYTRRYIYQKREAVYEKENFIKQHLPDIKTWDITNINKSIKLVHDYEPDLIIVFGTRRISKKFLQQLRCPIINVHHAVLPYIRGLDSAAWLCYLKRFEEIGSTIHYVNDKLDEGKILAKGKLDLPKGIKFWQIRKINTELTLKLMIDLLESWDVRKNNPEHNPSDVGDYYSWPSPWVYWKANRNLKKHVN